MNEIKRVLRRMFEDLADNSETAGRHTPTDSEANGVIGGGRDGRGALVYAWVHVDTLIDKIEEALAKAADDYERLVRETLDQRAIHNVLDTAVTSDELLKPCTPVPCPPMYGRLPSDLADKLAGMGVPENELAELRGALSVTEVCDSVYHVQLAPPVTCILPPGHRPWRHTGRSESGGVYRW